MNQIKRRKRHPFETRFSSQLAPAEKRSVWRRFWFFVTVLVGAAVGWFFLFAPYWQVESVVVEGLERIPQEQVLAVVPTAGGNIFRFSTGAVYSAVSKINEVYSVRIIRRLPRTVAIIVRERQPLFIWKTTQTLYHVDASGVAFRTVLSDEETAGLFVVQDTANVHVEIGQRVIPSRFVGAYAVVVKELPLIYPELIDHMEVGDTVFDLDVVMNDGRRVRFNILSDVEGQLADLRRIAQIRPDLFSRSVIDLRVDRWAYIK